MDARFLSWKILSVVAAVVVVGGLVAGCRPGCRSHGPRTEAEIREQVDDRVALLVRKLDATEDQKAKIYALRDRLMPDFVKLHQGHDAVAKEFAALWAAPTLDAAALDALGDKTVEQLKGPGRDLSQALAELHAILTPEQRQKLAQFHARHWRR